jgi:hypothetical protein
MGIYNLKTNRGDMSKFKQFAFLVATGCEYETEYDGRTYTRCAYCGNGLSDELSHEADCAMLEAQEVLGKEWVEHEEKRIEKENKRSVEQEYDFTWNNQIKCDICGKTVYERGLRQHKKDNHRCRSLRKSNQ